MVNRKTIITLMFSCFMIMVACQNKTAEQPAKEEVKKEMKDVKAKKAPNKNKASKAKKTQEITLSKKEVKKIIGSKPFKTYDAITKKFNNEKKAHVKKGTWAGAKNSATREDWLTRREAALIKGIGADNYAKILKK